MTLAAWALLAIGGVALLVALASAWRLSEGPVDVTRLVRFALPLLHPPPGLAVDRVRVAWSTKAGVPSLTLSVGAMTLRGDDGAIRDRFDDVRARFAPAPLLRLDAMPETVRIGAAQVMLVRERGGGIVPDGLTWRGGARQRAARPTSWIGWLPALRIDRLNLTLRDAADGQTVAVEGGTVQAGRGLGRAELRLPIVSAEMRLVVTATLVRTADGRVLDLASSRFDASLLPLVGPSIPFGGPVGIALHVAMKSDLTPISARADVELGTGRLAVGADALGVRDGRIVLGWEADRPATAMGSGRLSLVDCVLRLQAPQSPDAIVLRARGELAGDFVGPHGRLAGTLRLSTGPLDFAQLRAVWPVHAAYWARVWVAANLPTGNITGSEFTFGLASRAGLGGLGLESARGSLGVSNAVLRWLAPIEPATGVSGTVALVDADDLTIRATAGRVHGLDIAGTTMRIDRLNGAVQDAVIEAHLAGAVPDLVWVVEQKRLHLNANGGAIDLGGASGSVVGTVRVGLPLTDRVRMEQIGITAHAEFERLHLDRVALGRPIDDGAFALDATQDGLSLHGHARFAGSVVSTGLALDFRPGADDEATETATVSADLDAGTIGRAVPSRVLQLSGKTPVRLAYRLDHDRRATLSLDADLGPAAIASGFGWSKPAGQTGSAEGTLVLNSGRLTDIPDVRIQAPGLAIEAHGTVSAGRLGTVSLDRLTIGRTRASGTIALPPPQGGIIRVRLHGPMLDLVPLLKSSSHPAVPPAPARVEAATAPSGHATPDWSLQAQFTRVDLAHGLSVTGVSATLSGGGGSLANGTVTAAGPSPIDATLASGPRRERHVVLHAADTGALLRGLGVTSRISGGALVLEADLGSGAGPLAVRGKARLRKFRIVGTPLAARLLRDATIVGLADRAGRGNLTVDRLEVPFTVDGDVLHIDGLHAWQLALGITASGTIDLGDGAVAIDGTVIPAYAVNTLPGRLPLIGRLFSPERGGGLFAAKYRIDGDLDHPAIRFDALAALLPGALRSLLPP